MLDKNKDNFDVNSLINSAFEPRSKETLQSLFDKRIDELKMSPTSVLDAVGISYRTLKGILTGSQKTIDYMNLVRLARFLQQPKEKIVQLYVESLERNFPEDEVVSPSVIQFIKENFDLVALRQSKYISSVTNFPEIQQKLVDLFGLKTIFEYEKPKMDVAFSAGITHPKNELTRTTWISAAQTLFEDIENPYEYDRRELIEYFPQIRWHSTNVTRGLIEVIRDLFKLGVTVLFQDSLQGLQLHGATFAVNEKPCIVLTNHVGFYPTLWQSLIHELFHVLFDWDEIKKNGYHLSDEENEILTVQEKEDEANNFAREYLFSKEKSASVKPYLNNPAFVEDFAKNNHVHPSFIYVFHAKDIKSGNGTAWARARQNNPADAKLLIETLRNPWDNRKPNNEYVKYLKEKIYKV